MAEPSPRAGPLVSVLVPTFNRRRVLAEALASLVRQTYANFEAFVVNDGGEPVADLVAAFNDPRLIMIDRRENRGKAHCLNEALGRARGKYVAYLDDDDLFYPHHLASLVHALETRPECGAAYTDLYKVHCRVRPDGQRQVLGKVVTVSRDFDRFFICYFNHVLHVSLMHRRDLLEKTGLYNENLRVLIDWDMTRRLAHFTDFTHVTDVTGEFYGPVGESDRISYLMRLDKMKYLTQLMTIRATRPPKPWPKMPDLSIILLADRLDKTSAGRLRDIWLWTFMPNQVYLPLPAAQLARLASDMPHLVRVPVPDNAGRAARLDEALRRVEGDYVAVVPPDVQPASMWAEDPLHAAGLPKSGGIAFALAKPEGDWPAVVVGRGDLLRARAARPGVTLRESLAAAGIAVREPTDDERPLGFDRSLQHAQALEKEGAWARAGWLYDRIGAHFGNRRWMKERAAWALYRAGSQDGRATEMAREAAADRPTVSVLLLEAKLLRRAGRDTDAAAILEHAKEILSGKV